MTAAELAHALGGKLVGINVIEAPAPGAPPDDRSLRVVWSPNAMDGFAVMCRNDRDGCRAHVYERLAAWKNRQGFLFEGAA